MQQASLARRLLTALLAGILLAGSSHAQLDREVVSPAQFDPSDVYFQGYLSARGAEKLEATGDHIGAVEKYRQAVEYFSTVRKYYPDWRSDMVQRRNDKTKSALAAADQKANEQLKQQRNVVAELEGGAKQGAEIPNFQPSTPNILKADPVATRRLKEAETEVARLRRLLDEQRRETNRLQDSHRSGSSITAKQLRELQEKSSRELAAARNEIRRLQAEAAVQDHHQAQAEGIARLLRAEQAKIAELQREAKSLREQGQHLSIKGAEMSDQQLAKAKAEIRRLKRETTMANIQAEAEIARLKKVTGEMEAEAQDKIAQHQNLARNAKAHAQKEIDRLQELHGSEREQAEKEIQRLSEIAAKAQADAERELEQLRRNTVERQSATKAEIERLRKFAEKTSQDAEAKELEYDLRNARQLALIRELEQNQQQSGAERKQIEAKLQAAETDVRQLKARLAKAPLESEVQTLDLRIKQLEQERQAMALSLQQSQNGHAQAKGRIATLEKELHQARQQAVDLNRDLIAERDATNAVVAGQRRQLEALQKQLDEKSTALAGANQQIAQLQLELTQSKDAYGQLRDERDALMMERDQMAALLKLNEAGRIQDLIDQNMGLAKKLRESDETLKRMQRNSHADKDAITEALRDLAIAKSQINRLHQEKREHEQRILDLQQRLENEQQALASGQASADPQEVALLRDIIRRQLRMQTARRQARELLMNAVKGLSSEDEDLSEAVQLLEAQELALSPEEQKLVADRQVDGEFISPFARDRKTVDQATAKLRRDIDVFDRAAKKAFVSGRLHPTRELYEMILEQHPGHIPTLCKMGVVQLKLDRHRDAADSFQRAIELENNNAYALRMLSYALMKSESYHDAETAARKSVEIDPNDAKTHMLLATLCFRLGKPGDAESHFKGAINADPMPSEPYYNLALIYSGSGRTKQALQYYRQALERGALPDPELEQEIAAQ